MSHVRSISPRYRPPIAIVRIVVAIALCLLTWAPQATAQTTDEWTTSLHDVARDAASTDTTLSPANAAQLTRKWTFATGGPVASSPTVSGGVAYFGSWDGYEYAVNVSTGALVWKTFIGTTTATPDCIPPALGVSSPATVSNGVVYVGGGNQYWYALNATTGAVEWDVLTGSTTGAYDGHYNWSGPLVYNGYAYVGISSLGDCPLVQGQLLKISLTSHSIVNTLNIVPNGQVGGGIWTSPALDVATNTIYTATGTKNASTQQYAQAFLAIDANTMEIKDHWELPESEAVLDSDFGTSTILFTDSTGRNLVASINKNGTAYAFLRSNLAAGPVWQQTIAEGGDCPTCGESSVSSGAFGAGDVYFAGGQGTIGGEGYPGTVDGINSATGAYTWQHPTTGSVIGALAYDNGLVFDGGGSVFEALNAATGATLYSYDTGSQIYAGPSVADGMVFVGNTAGDVEAFGLGTSATPPADPNCPGGFTCQDIGNTTPAGTETVTGGSWSVAAGGGGLAGTADSARLESEPATGDDSVSAAVTGLPSGQTNAQAGVTIRASNDPGSPYFSVVEKPGNTVVVQDRTTWGGASNVLSSTTGGALPQYVMVQRVANTLTAAISADGVHYTLIPGTTTTLVLPAAALAGLVASSGNNGTLGTSTFADVTIGAPTITPMSAPPAGACPSGWSCADIGNPYVAGNQSLTSGTWTVSGAGGDIWNNADQFHYVWQPITGDSTLSAEVTSQSNTNTDAKAGVMYRGGTNTDAAYYAAYVFPDGNIHVQYRDTAGWTANELTTQAQTLPAYIEIARSGTTYTTYTSTNGTTWTPVPNSTVSEPNLSGTIDGGLAVSSHNTSEASTATFTNVAFGTTAPPPPTLCPTGWTCQDIGFPTPAGSQTLSGGNWTIQAGGGDIWDIYDSFRFISQPINGNGGISADLTSQENTGSWEKAGTMMRLSSDPASPYFAAFATPGNGIVVQWRSVQGGTTNQIGIAGTAPTYLDVSRVGDTFTAYTSTNGTTWNAITGSQQTIATMGGTVLGGMAADSYDTTTLNTTTWSNVVVTTGGGTGGIPVPWTDGDIGSPAPAGSATYTNNTFTVNGGGNDIWANSDQLNYVSQPMTGDGEIVAQVTNQSNTNPWAKAGIMIKSSTMAGSPYAAMMVTPGNGVHFQANFNQDSAGPAYTFPNVWLKMTRDGNVFTGYESADATNWVQVGQTTISMPLSATVGMFVDSHDGGTLGTANFTNVVVTPTGGGPLPSPWVSDDIGTPLLPGSASYANGTYTVKGSGDDIWGTADDFQFANQPLTGNGQIIAQVTGQDNTDPWAKSGIMIKSSDTSGSPYAALMVTPGNGIHFQSNFNSDVYGGSYAFPNTWLKLVRNGSTITAFTSVDGNNWTQVGTATVNLPSTAEIGLFVCAHDETGQLNTSTFNNVSVAVNTALPTGWTDTDVGSPGIAGSAQYSGGVFTVEGSGDDIWQNADEFNYAYQTVSGNASIVARVTAQANTDPWAKSGVMIKQSTTAFSNYADLFVTPGNGVHFQSDFTSDQAGGAANLPEWLKLTRAGGTITAYTSPDGNTWTQVGSPVTISLTDPITIGLFVCAHNGSAALNTSSFDNVTVTP